VGGAAVNLLLPNIPARILTVDDEAVIVDEIVDSLSLQAIDALGLCNPSEALEALRADPRITVLLTDLDMPGITGLQLAEQALAARSEETALEVVLLTAHANLDAAIDAMRIGVFDLLRKPPRLTTLRDTLERAHQKAADRRTRHLMMTAQSPSSDTTAGGAPAPPAEPAAESDGGGTFLSVISHEFRTPLNPIIGFSQLIEQNNGSLPEGEVKEYARYIREAGESLFDLTESVLKLTEIKARPPKAFKEWEQPYALLRRLRSKHADAASARGQRLDIHYNAEQIVFTDGDMLVEALNHLVANAIAFSPHGAEITLTVRTRGREMAFSVIDNGPGMSAPQLKRALRPFEQLDLRHTRSHGGLGIGLPLAGLLAGCLDGRLDIDTRPAEGTKASIWLPLVGKAESH